MCANCEISAKYRDLVTCERLRALRDHLGVVEHEGLVDVDHVEEIHQHLLVQVDPELRDQLAALRVVPLLRFARAQIVLELPGGRAQAQVQAAPSAAPTASPEAGAATSANSGAAESSAKKRKRFKEPNPLSVKKKQRKTTPSSNERQSAGASNADGEGAEARKKVRRGRR